MALLPFTTSANLSVAAALVANIRCPICRRQGAFHGRGDVNDISWNQPATEEHVAKNVSATYRAGVRLCPSTDCQAPVFVIMMGREVVKVYPPEVLDFDTTALPQHIASTLEESVKAHSAECFRASALMVRRVLEEVCKDSRSLWRVSGSTVGCQRRTRCRHGTPGGYQRFSLQRYRETRWTL